MPRTLIIIIIPLKTELQELVRIHNIHVYYTAAAFLRPCVHVAQVLARKVSVCKVRN